MMENAVTENELRLPAKILEMNKGNMLGLILGRRFLQYLSRNVYSDQGLRLELF